MKISFDEGKECLCQCAMGQRSSQAKTTIIEDKTSIPLWEYNHDKRHWSEKMPMKESNGSQLGEFRVSTYNIWFNNQYQPMRFQSLCKILNQSEAEIIGLQEVTKTTLDKLLNESFIRDRYFISDIDCRTFHGWYGVILLISKHINVSQLNLIDFPQSNMGRRLILADIQFNPNEFVRIGTVHLESTDNKLQRSEQLNICQNAFQLRSPASYILMGDFNFSDDNQENSDQFQILSQWIDVWKALINPDKYRYTFDTEINSMAKLSKGHSTQSRCDRIILQSQTIQPKQIEILGNQLIGHQANLEVFTSDHFGLTAVFQTKQ